MKNLKTLYRETFQLPGQNGRLTDKVFLTRIASSIAVILVLMAAMGLSAYAYFTSDLQTSANNITSASYAVDLKITYKDANDADVEVPLTNNGASLTPGVEYTVTANRSEESTASTGFVCVNIANGTAIYNTSQVGADTNVEGGWRDSLTFKLTINSSAAEPVHVAFVPTWGTSVYYSEFVSSNGTNNPELYITDNEVITVTVN